MHNRQYILPKHEQNAQCTMDTAHYTSTHNKCTTVPATCSSNSRANHHMRPAQTRKQLQKARTCSGNCHFTQLKALLPTCGGALGFGAVPEPWPPLSLSTMSAAAQVAPPSAETSTRVIGRVSSPIA
eukprot:GHRQ01019008.1.p1 GENE.GHRQ01019008.1~~GHRQ01019008.1.p1  ORF type:complete len:127 (+),score=25.56 GHRQ01019008.1:121-501(+)